MNKIELLAPAGDVERAKTALLYGADAVYIGGHIGSLRARASNFTLTDIKEVADFAHARQKKVYVTVNIIPHDREMTEMEEYLKELDSAHIDAIIVSSLSIVALVKQLNLHFACHASTQLSTLNVGALDFLTRQGMSRVVLGRECSLKDIESILAQTTTEIEVFIHGGMCLSYSGRCVLSNYLTGRDANRGGCAHCCRWDYVFDDQVFFMGSRDLEGVEAIPKLIKMGVSSLKIEGRMKTAYYLACVVGTYRLLIDDVYAGTVHESSYYKARLSQAESRPGATGFFFHRPGMNEQLFSGINHIPRQDFLGVVVKYDGEAHRVFVSERNHFNNGDEVEFMSPSQNYYHLTIKNLKDKNNQDVLSARVAEEVVSFDCDYDVQEGNLMRIYLPKESL